MKQVLFIVFICVLLLLSYIFVVPLLLPKPTYVIGFPKEESNGRTEMLLYYGTKGVATATHRSNGITEFSQLVNENDRKHIVRRSITDDMVNKHFQPIGGTSENGKEFGTLRDSFYDVLANQEEAKQTVYPTVTVEKDKTITITSMLAEENISVTNVLSDYGKQTDDFFTVDIQQADEDAFLMSLYFSSARDEDVYHLFIAQDLSHIEVVDGESEPYSKAIESGILDAYVNILYKAELSDRFAAIYGLDGIYDLEKETVVFIDEDDVLSEDGRYVYLKGDHEVFEKGKQKIQKAEDYALGNKKYHSIYRMNFRQIAREFGLKTFGKTTEAKLIYFNEDYAMYTFSFEGILFGSGGNVNVIVDLQENPEDPTFYLFNFRIS